MAATTAASSTPIPFTRTSLVSRSTSTDVTPASFMTSSVTATLQ
jgi:hypothetical protein